MRKEIEAIITGRVQMVMYRDFAERKARGLNIVGIVQNESDGSVFVIAQGEEEDLEKYFTLLKKGPTLSRVDNIETKERKELGKYALFNIVF